MISNSTSYKSIIQNSFSTRPLTYSEFSSLTHEQYNGMTWNTCGRLASHVRQPGFDTMNKVEVTP